MTEDEVSELIKQEVDRVYKDIRALADSMEMFSDNTLEAIITIKKHYKAQDKVIMDVFSKLELVRRELDNIYYMLNPYDGLPKPPLTQ